jgi:hypothetical protein
MRIQTHRDQSRSRHFDLIGGAIRPRSIDLVSVAASGILLAEHLARSTRPQLELGARLRRPNSFGDFGLIERFVQSPCGSDAWPLAESRLARAPSTERDADMSKRYTSAHAFHSAA